MTAPLDLAGIARWVSRPGATPAPTTPRPTPAEPFPAPWPGGPCATEKACGCGVLNREQCDCADFAAQARTAARKPIFFDFRNEAA